MTKQPTRHRLPQLLCAILGVVLVGTAPAMAVELPDEHGGGNDCSDRHTTAYDAIDTVEDTRPDDELTEADTLGQIQAIVTQLNIDVTRMGCAAEE